MDEATRGVAWSTQIRAAWDAGVTIAEMCNEFGCSETTLARWAAGERVPREGTFRLMRSALHDMIVAKTAS